MHGLIYAGYCSQSSMDNKAQSTHNDQIIIQELNASIFRQKNVNPQLLTIKKLVDKPSSLLNKSTSENEVLTCEFDLYRTSRSGTNELYYKVKLTNAQITNIQFSITHVVNNNAALHNDTTLIIGRNIRGCWHGF